ncbi:MAG: hypothetical protein HY775_01005 [Acidobacteria bacterium]|nr:hypothetical protein [Acidobacteriota bacterium]
MNLWSRGLGRRELGMDFRQYVVRRAEDGGFDIFGVTHGPVAWEFRIHVEPEDVAGLVNVGLTRPVMRLLLRRWATAVATLWRRRRFKPADGLEERVAGAYARMMGERRPSAGGPATAAASERTAT